jgi:preprotein translocase subunit SecE
MLDLFGAYSFVVSSFVIKESPVAAESAKPKRRMIKKAETVREKTEKSLQAPKEKKNGVLRLALSYIGAPFRFIGRLFTKLGQFLGKYRIFRAIGKVCKFIGRILWPAYFRNSWKELRQVTWPTRRETWQLTLAVIIFSVIFGVIIAFVDYGLDKAFKQILIK